MGSTVLGLELITPFVLEIRLFIDKDGRPTRCLPRQGRVERVFEEAACNAAMRYARYEPALDAQGAPVPSYTVTSIIYSL